MYFSINKARMRQAHATDTSSVTSSLNAFSGTDHNFSIAGELILLLLILTQESN